MKKVVVFLVVLAFAGYASADALNDAVAVWQFGDWTDDNGPPNTDWDTLPGFLGSSVGVDVFADGIQALNSDGWAAQASSYSYVGGINPGELVLTGGMTMFASQKHSFGGIDDILQMGNGETDWNCVYGVSLEDAEPRFIIRGAGQGADEAPLYAGMTLSADTWYDITGVFDPGDIGDDSGTLDLYVYSPMDGGQLAHTSTTVPFDALETDPAILNEMDMFVIYNAWHGVPDAGNLIELSAVWDRALTVSEVAGLSAGEDRVPGDANGDGVADEADLRILLDNYFITDPRPEYSQGNFNFDETVDEQDYLIWETSFLDAGGVLPEPTTLTLLIPAALALLARRRRLKGDIR